VVDVSTLAMITPSFAARAAMSISVEKFPGNSVQKFPLGQPAFGCFLRCLKRNESLPVSRISQ
jgi:hypothetical protein